MQQHCSRLRAIQFRNLAYVFSHRMGKNSNQQNDDNLFWNENKNPFQFQIKIDQMIREHPHTSLQNLTNICLRASQRTASTDKAPNALKRPEHSKY